MVNLMRKESFERAKKVKLIIMDVDGTLTDGGIYIGESGELFKSFNCRDGFGITLAKRAGIQIALITGRSSKQLLVRAQELKIDSNAIWQGDLDKREAYIEVKNRFHLKDEDIAYIGDDILDLPIMMQVGFTGTVANAVTEVKTRVCVVSDFNGGQGAVREIIEFILKAKGLWQNIVAEYLDTENKKPKDPFYLLGNKSNQAAPPTRVNPLNTPSKTVLASPTPVTRPAPAAKPTPQAKPLTPPQASAPTQRNTQAPRDENLEKLDKIGQKLNVKF